MLKLCHSSLGDFHFDSIEYEMCLSEFTVTVTQRESFGDDFPPPGSSVRDKRFKFALWLQRQLEIENRFKILAKSSNLNYFNYFYRTRGSI